MGDYIIVFKDMPTRIKAATTRNEDDTYTIIVNSRLNYEQQYNSFKHELHHIQNCDFNNEQDISVLEYNTHRICNNN